MDSDLLNAANKGHIKPFEEKVRHLEKIIDDSKETILHVNIKSRTPSTEFVKKILKLCPRLLLQVDDKGNTPLHVAARSGVSKIVEVLLESARDQTRGERVVTTMLKMKTSDEKTVFDVAMEYKKIDVVKILIKESDSDFFDYSNIIGKVLNLAAESGDDEILDTITKDHNGNSALLKELSKYGTPETQPMDSPPISPDLFIAVHKGEIERFKVIEHLEQIVTFSKDTILHLHIKSSKTSIEFVEKILEKCPLLLLQVNDEGDTPLHVAAKRGDSKIVEILLQCARYQHQEQESEMLKIRNKEGKTALEEALRHEKNKEEKIKVVKILIKKAGTNFPYSVNNLYEMLYLAIVEGDYEMMVEVIELRSYHWITDTGNEEKSMDENANALNRQIKEAAIERAVKKANDENVKKRAIDEVVMNLVIPGTESMGTILHIHVQFSRKPSTNFVGKILRNYPSLIRKFDANRNTLLHVSAKSGHLDIAELLLNHARDNHQGPEIRQMLSIINNEYNTALHEAVQQGKIEIVNILTKADTEISYGPNKSGLTPLHFAAAKGNFEMVVAMVGSDINPGTQSAEIVHMHMESSWPSAKFVDKILDKYPSLLQQKNAQGDTLLHVAAKHGQFNIVENLLKRARDQHHLSAPEVSADKHMLRMRNEEDNTALHEAVQYGNTQVVEILTKADPQFPDSPNKSGKTPLYLAAEKGNYGMVVAIVGSGDCPECTEPWAKRVNIQRSQFLEDQSQNLDKLWNCLLRRQASRSCSFKDSDSWEKIPTKDTILHVHVKSSQTSTKFVKEIVEKYPELLVKVNAKGDTPLHVAAKHGHYEVANVLIERAIKSRHQEQGSGPRADLQMLRMTNTEKYTALHEAVRHGNTRVVEILTKADPSFTYSETEKKCQEETPLYLAAATGNYEMVVAIVENCKSFAYKGPNQMTALHAVVIRGAPGDHLRIMRKILEKNKSLAAAQDYYGWTPLHYAAYYGFSDKVSLLLEFEKSAVNILDYEQNMTALHMAASQGYKDIVENIILESVECCEKVDKRGWNVLHFAMLSLPKKELNDLLTNPLVWSLKNKKDNNGNTPLHIRAVAYRDSFNFGNHQASVEDMLKHSCRKLEEDLEDLFDHVGRNGQFQKGVICETKDHESFKIRRKKYYDGLKKKSPHLLVATLIATVTFTAAFTIPGGYISEKGSDEGTAILNRDLAFQLFILTDTIAMTLSLSAVFVHFIMSFQKFEKQDSLLTLALWLTLLAMGIVVIAFVTGVYSVLEPSLWLAIASCSFGLAFFLLIPCALISTGKLFKRQGGSADSLPTQCKKRN